MTNYSALSDIETSKLAAHAVNAAVNGFSASTIAKNWSILYGDNPDVEIFGEVGALPGGCSIRVGNALLCVAMHGVSDRTLDPFIDGMGPDERCNAANGLNWAIDRALSTDGLAGKYLLFPQVKLTLFTGFSLGGQVAFSLGSLWHQYQLANQMGVVTFGSPRPFTGMSPRLKQFTRMIRWMRYLDAVTSIPPRWYESQLSFVALCIKAGCVIADFWQPPGGRVIDESGVVTPSINTGFHFPVSDAEFASWASGRGGSLSAAHQWPLYFQQILHLQETGVPFWVQDKALGLGESLSGLPISFEVQRQLMAAGIPMPAMGGCPHGPTTSRVRVAAQNSQVL